MTTWLGSGQRVASAGDCNSGTSSLRYSRRVLVGASSAVFARDRETRALSSQCGRRRALASWPNWRCAPASGSIGYRRHDACNARSHGRTISRRCGRAPETNRGPSSGSSAHARGGPPLCGCAAAGRRSASSARRGEPSGASGARRSSPDGSAQEHRKSRAARQGPRADGGLLALLRARDARAVAVRR